MKRTWTLLDAYSGPFWMVLLAIFTGMATGRCDDDHSPETWWAFEPLDAIMPPSEGTAPDWVQNGIDQHVLARLERLNLVPNPKADSRTLMRRAAFVLTGLPPTWEELELFREDPSHGAWARGVHRLLDHPRYGERWGRHWLDVARFAESSGFEHDYDREGAYHFRDFVIKALNADMPYDQFVRWQLAGDEYEADNPLALMATGFLGAGVFPTQITANEVERVRYDAMDDMLSTTTTAMLGLTVGCARCHDHKTDPISTEEYYRMLSTFTTTVRSEIELDLEPEKQQQALKVYHEEHGRIKQALEAYSQNTLPGKFDVWLKSMENDTEPIAWRLLEPAKMRSEAGATFVKQSDGSFLAKGVNGESDVYSFVADLKEGELRALRLDAMADASMPGHGPGRAVNGNIGLSRVQVFVIGTGGANPTEVKLVKPRATFEQNDTHLSIGASLDEDPKTGWAVDPQFGRDHAAIYVFEKPLLSKPSTQLEVRLEFSLNTGHNMGRVRLSVSSREDLELNAPVLPSKIALLLTRLSQGKMDDLSDDERSALMAWWKPLDPGWQGLKVALQEYQLRKPIPHLSKVMICGEGFPPHRMHSQGVDFYKETYVLRRGRTDSKDSVALPGFPSVLTRLPEESSKRWEYTPPEGSLHSGRRRALAEWMTDVDHGAGNLLARVIVNRLWQHHFGQGLVATPNDFGKSGAPPEHKQLLDWLALRLVDHEWRLKPLHHLIMSSATWQQASFSPDLGNRPESDMATLPKSFFPLQRRLEAEAIRDSLLSVSGLLETRMYGPGILDAGTRRASIYLRIKRSQRVNAMQIFDAPEPLTSQGLRPTTTVAPQALLHMNSAHVREWAASFAATLLQGVPLSSSGAESVQRAYTVALNRLPTGSEEADGVAFLLAQTNRHDKAGRSDPSALALTDFAQVIMNLNEFIYVE
ncbi:DUF1549 and DUF1553 domain-containing protein [Verrucomicrobia bacterium]|nr:DUF1549 and DUF1553 domain-containing protein [Verrucomicrobiota bacterium]